MNLGDRNRNFAFTKHGKQNREAAAMQRVLAGVVGQQYYAFNGKSTCLSSGARRFYDARCRG